jgi:hypothetical protein
VGKRDGAGEAFAMVLEFATAWEHAWALTQQEKLYSNEQYRTSRKLQA